MCNLVDHAIREFRAAGWLPHENKPQDPKWPDDPQTWMMENILALMRVFSEQGHSGTSAPYCISTFAKLAKYEPLVPLTGEPKEWTRVGDDIGDGMDDGMYQNNRCSHVFKDTLKGQAYDSEGKIFREPDGNCYQSGDSRVDIEFPYTPTTEYVDVSA